MDFIEYSLRTFLMLEAILMAFFGFLYGTHTKYFTERTEINGKKEFSEAVFFVGRACTKVYYLIVVANILIIIDLLILFSCELYRKSWTSFLNGGGILFFAISITFVCHNLKRTLKTSRD